MFLLFVGRFLKNKMKALLHPDSKEGGQGTKQNKKPQISRQTLGSSDNCTLHGETLRLKLPLLLPCSVIAFTRQRAKPAGKGPGFLFLSYRTIGE